VGLVSAVVERLLANGDEVLFLIGYDQGMESVGQRVHVAERLVRASLEESLASGDVAVATQGTSAFIYVAPGFEARLPDLRAFFA